MTTEGLAVTNMSDFASVGVNFRKLYKLMDTLVTCLFTFVKRAFCWKFVLFQHTIYNVKR